MKFQVDTEKLRDLMVQQKLPVADAARAAGISRQALENILNAKNGCRERTIYKLARGLDADPLEFATFVEG